MFRWNRWEARDVAPIVTLLVLVVFFTVVTGGGFWKLSTVEQILTQGAILAIAAAGMTFVLLCGEIDLAVGNLALSTACLCGWMFNRMQAAGSPPSGMGLFVCFVVPLLVTVLMGAVSGLLVVSSRLPSFIITLAMMNIAQGFAQLMTEGRTFSVPTQLAQLGNQGVTLFQWTVVNHKNVQIPARFSLPYTAIVAALVMIAGHIVLQHTLFGRYLYMTGGNRQAARLAGIRCDRILIATLAITAFCGGLAGLLAAGRFNSVSMDQNAELLLSAVACVVLGGTSLFGGEGGMGKTFIGVLTFTVLYVGLNQTRIYEHARPMVMGVVLMAALVLNGFLARTKR